MHIITYTRLTSKCNYTLCHARKTGHAQTHMQPCPSELWEPWTQQMFISTYERCQNYQWPHDLRKLKGIRRGNSNTTKCVSAKFAWSSESSEIAQRWMTAQLQHNAFNATKCAALCFSTGLFAQVLHKAYVFETCKYISSAGFRFFLYGTKCETMTHLETGRYLNKGPPAGNLCALI